MWLQFARSDGAHWSGLSVPCAIVAAPPGQAERAEQHSRTTNAVAEQWKRRAQSQAAAAAEAYPPRAYSYSPHMHPGYAQHHDPFSSPPRARHEQQAARPEYAESQPLRGASFAHQAAADPAAQPPPGASTPVSPANARARELLVKLSELATDGTPTRGGREADRAELIELIELISPHR